MKKIDFEEVQILNDYSSKKANPAYDETALNTDCFTCDAGGCDGGDCDGNCDGDNGSDSPN